MKLYVTRHGPAEDQAPSGVDADRALTPAGRGRVIGVARARVGAGELPLLIVTSPLVRAVQTAEIMALETRLGERDGRVVVMRDVAPGGSQVRLAHRLAAEQRKRVMFVGHEPDLSALVSALLGGFERPFEKAMVVAVHVPPGAGACGLRFVLDPRSMSLESPAGA